MSGLLDQPPLEADPFRTQTGSQTGLKAEQDPPPSPTIPSGQSTPPEPGFADVPPPLSFPPPFGVPPFQQYTGTPFAGPEIYPSQSVRPVVVPFDTPSNIYVPEVVIQEDTKLRKQIQTNLQAIIKTMVRLHQHVVKKAFEEISFIAQVADITNKKIGDWIPSFISLTSINDIYSQFMKADIYKSETVRSLLQPPFNNSDAMITAIAIANAMSNKAQADNLAFKLFERNYVHLLDQNFEVSSMVSQGMLELGRRVPRMQYVSPKQLIHHQDTRAAFARIVGYTYLFNTRAIMPRTQQFSTTAESIRSWINTECLRFERAVVFNNYVLISTGPIQHTQPDWNIVSKHIKEILKEGLSKPLPSGDYSPITSDNESSTDGEEEEEEVEEEGEQEEY